MARRKMKGLGKPRTRHTTAEGQIQDLRDRLQKQARTETRTILINGQPQKVPVTVLPCPTTVTRD